MFGIHKKTSNIKSGTTPYPTQHITLFIVHDGVVRWEAWQTASDARYRAEELYPDMPQAQFYLRSRNREFWEFYRRNPPYYEGGINKHFHPMDKDRVPAIIKAHLLIDEDAR